MFGQQSTRPTSVSRGHFWKFATGTPRISSSSRVGSGRQAQSAGRRRLSAGLVGHALRQARQLVNSSGQLRAAASDLVPSPERRRVATWVDSDGVHSRTICTAERVHAATPPSQQFTAQATPREAGRRGRRAATPHPTLMRRLTRHIATWQHLPPPPRPHHVTRTGHATIHLLAHPR